MRHAVAGLLGVVVCAWAAQAAAQDPAAFYDANCAPCHTIGGGPQGGPDLKGVTSRRDRDWLIRFMLDPAAFESDPEVVRMMRAADGMMMPQTEGLDRPMAEALLTFIERRSGVEPAAPAAAVDAPAAPADIDLGRALFTGASRLSGKGPACVGCHDAAVAAPGGGRLAPDLVAAHERFGGRTGLTAWLGSPPTPMMRALYRPSPLTADESRALAAFLEQSASAAREPASPAARIAALGAGATALVFLAAGVIWRGRFSGVRRPLVARAVRRAALPSNPALRPRPSDPSRDWRSGGLR